MDEKICEFKWCPAFLEEFSGNCAVHEVEEIVNCPVQKVVLDLQDDLMILALRIYGENPMTSGPEVRTIMKRLEPELIKKLNSENC